MGRKARRRPQRKWTRRTKVTVGVCAAVLGGGALAYPAIAVAVGVAAGVVTTAAQIDRRDG